ncbi:N-acetylglucosamine kinase [Clostridium sp.]|uniref:N-acetylglucosamine kinase n=1 Tax=Clostridium sp. TaxID=1506 RepID=UPI003F30E076
MNYIIGVDGGGTKTEAVAYDLNGNPLETALSGFGNLLNNEEEAVKNIIKALDELVNKLGMEGLKGIYLGLAAAEAGNNASIVYNKVKEKYNIESIVMNDGDLALKALLKGEDGILVIAGTGSVAFGLNNNKQSKCGGWGNLLGDEGSAYKISIEAYKKMIYDFEYKNTISPLSKEILESINAKTVNDIVGYIYGSTKDEVAKVAALVSKYAENGDEFSINLLKAEGTAIAKTTARVFEMLEFDECKIGLVGSVIRKSIFVKNAFEGYLNEHINVKEFIYDDVSPTKGAYYLYKNSSN